MPSTVLIVEDYADTRMLMTMLVESYGYRAVEAEDGYQAIEKTKEYNPDLILMDISLPLLDGLSATEAIREIERFHKTPIIAVTAYSDVLAKEPNKAGFNEVLRKPLAFDQLESLIKRYLRTDN